MRYLTRSRYNTISATDIPSGRLSWAVNAVQCCLVKSAFFTFTLLLPSHSSVTTISVCARYVLLSPDGECMCMRERVWVPCPSGPSGSSAVLPFDSPPARLSRDAAYRIMHIALAFIRARGPTFFQLILRSLSPSHSTILNSITAGISACYRSEITLPLLGLK